MLRRIPLPVLVVAEDVDEGESLLSTLEQLGCSVEVAQTGDRAKEIGRDFRPQVVLIDVVKPVIDGYQTIVALKKHEWSRSTLFVAHTLSQDPLVLRVLQDIGFHSHVLKPATAEALESIVVAMRGEGSPTVPAFEFKRRRVRMSEESRKSSW